MRRPFPDAGQLRDPRSVGRHCRSRVWARGLGRTGSPVGPGERSRAGEREARSGKGWREVTRTPLLRVTVVVVLSVCAFRPVRAQHAKIISLGLENSKLHDALVDFAERLGSEAIKKQGNIDSISDAFDPLSPDDSALEPTYPAPQPYPSECVAARGPGDTFELTPDAAKCRDCGFSEALNELQRTRYRLEKLRRVGLQTKNLISNSLAVGDSMAGAAGVGGLAWVTERANILKTYAGFKQTYDAKYAELMALLQKTLQQIAACEEKVFGNKSWYQRFGFMYYEFMAAFYKRTE